MEQNDVLLDKLGIRIGDTSDANVDKFTTALFKNKLVTDSIIAFVHGTTGALSLIQNSASNYLNENKNSSLVIMDLVEKLGSSNDEIVRLQYIIDYQKSQDSKKMWVTIVTIIAILCVIIGLFFLLKASLGSFTTILIVVLILSFIRPILKVATSFI